jgi:uncharacterized membrane protein
MKFGTAEGAGKAMRTLGQLGREHVIEIQDAAIVTWPEGKKKPKTEQLRDLTAMGALDGAFWGMLFGFIFLMPFLGMAVGAASGALAGMFSDMGIDKNFIGQCQDKITVGTSALFVLSETQAADKVIDALKPLHPEIIKTNLSKDSEQKLREAFAHEA